MSKMAKISIDFDQTKNEVYLRFQVDVFSTIFKRKNLFNIYSTIILN